MKKLKALLIIKEVEGGEGGLMMNLHPQMRKGGFNVQWGAGGGGEGRGQENVEKVECEVCRRQLTSFVNNELVDCLKTLEG